MELCKVIRILDGIFKLPLAEPWDNVGILVQPSSPLKISKIMLTNDLTEPVMKEAISFGTNFIISYHPPLFRSLKKITQNTWKERIIIQALENRIGIYSPHTALDAVSNGVNDWLLSPFEFTTINPINRHTCKEQSWTYSGKMNEHIKQLGMKLSIPPLQTDVVANTGRVVKFQSSPTDINLDKMNSGDAVIDVCEPLTFYPNEGAGRVGLLKYKHTIADIVSAYKKLFDVSYLKLALGSGKTMESSVTCLAVCAGSGGSLFSQNNLSHWADVLITGEASHHEQLDVVARGVTIITAGHSVTERGYLTDRLKPWLDKVIVESQENRNLIQVLVSEMDKEPGDIM